MHNDGGAKTEMQQLLNRLGAKFLQRTTLEVASLLDCLARIRSGDSQALELLQQLTHRIHGTGATLGFSAISACAGKIEHWVEQTAGSASPADPARLGELEKLTAQLNHEIGLARDAQDLQG
jgi:HPt (histidine-containing phosphotransfer) domain-containing protein